MKCSPLRFLPAQAYANNLVDYHLIMDLLPVLAYAFFAGRLPASLSAGQAAILLSLGLQQNDVSVVEQSLNLPAQQVLALFCKVRRKQYTCRSLFVYTVRLHSIAQNQGNGLHPSCLTRLFSS